MRCLLALALLPACFDPPEIEPKDTAVECVPTDEVPYDGVDQDCDGYDLTDVDGDVWDAVEAGGEDCDDSDPDINPWATELCNDIDDDCDGLVDGQDPDLADGTTWYTDGDGDGYGDEDDSLVQCDQPSGYITTGEDCDDGDADVNPLASETCNEIDDDCDGLVDDDDDSVSGRDMWYDDDDGDGYGDAGEYQPGCQQPTGYVADATDCDDGDDAVNPAADELCNLTDDDCDGLVDDDDDSVTGRDMWYADDDGDGYGDVDDYAPGCEQPSGYVADDTDCDDSDAAVSPAGSETCSGVDDDCDGLVDDDDPDVTGRTMWYADDDGDGYGDVDDYAPGCEQPSGYVFYSSDCDDGDAEVHPSAVEECNGVDDDCDGAVDSACCEDTGASCEDDATVTLFDEDNPFLGYSFRGGCYNGGDDPDEIVLWSPYADAEVEVATLDGSGEDLSSQTVTVAAGEVEVVECSSGDVLRVDTDEPLQVLMTGTTDTAVLWDDDWIGMHGDDLLIRMLSVKGGYGIVSYDDDNAVTVTSIDGVSSALDTVAVLDAGETLLLEDFTSLGYSFSADVWLHVETTYPVSTVFGMFSDNAGTQLYSGDMTSYLAPIHGSLTLLVSGGDQEANVTFTELADAASPVTAVIAAETLQSFTVTVSDWALLDISSDVPLVAITQDGGSGYAPAIQYSSQDEPGRVGSSYGAPMHKTGPEITIISLVDDNDITLWGCLTDSFTLDLNGYEKPGSCSGEDLLMASGTGPFVLDTSYGGENATAWLPVSGEPSF